MDLIANNHELPPAEIKYRSYTWVQKNASVKSLQELFKIHDYVLKHPECTHNEIITFAETSKYQTQRYSTMIKQHPEQLKIKLDELEWLLKNPS